MLPAIVERRIKLAEAVAATLRDSAGACTSEKAALRATLITGAQAIDDMVDLARSQTQVAKWNHDVIVESRA